MGDDENGWFAAAVAFIVGSSGAILRLFTTQSAHATRIERLEEDRREHADKIEQTHTTVTTMQGDVTAIRGLLESGRQPPGPPIA